MKADVSSVSPSSERIEELQQQQQQQQQQQLYFLTLNIQISHHLQIARLIEAGGVWMAETVLCLTAKGVKIRMGLSCSIGISRSLKYIASQARLVESAAYINNSLFLHAYRLLLHLLPQTNKQHAMHAEMLTFKSIMLYRKLENKQTM